MLFESLNGRRHARVRPRISLSLSLCMCVCFGVCEERGWRGATGWDTQEMRMSTSWDLTGNLYTAMFIIQSLSRRQMEGQ